MGAGGGGVVGDLVVERDGTDRAAVFDRLGALGGVEHQLHVAVLHPVGDGAAALVDLVHHLGGDAIGLEPGSGAPGREDGKAELDNDPDRFEHVGRLVGLLDRDEHGARLGQMRARAHLRLEEGAREVAVPAHDLAGRAHFRPQDRVDAGEAGEGQHRLLDREPRHLGIAERERIGEGDGFVVGGTLGVRGTVGEVGHRLAGHQPRGDRGDRRIGGLGDEGHGARGARVDLDEVDRLGAGLVGLDRELHVHQPLDLERHGQRLGLALDLGDHLGRKAVRRQAAGAVAGMDAGLLDVLHDARDMHGLAVGERIDIDLDRAGEISVEQHRAVAGHHHRLTDVAPEVVEVAHDLHRPSAEHVGGADHQREADLFGELDRLDIAVGDGVFRLLEVEVMDQVLEALAVFGEVDGVGRGAEDRDPGLFERVGELERRLATELDDHPVQGAVLLLLGQDLHHVFEGERLEIEPVRSVVIGRNGLGVAVDHDRLVADVGQAETGVAAAIVELDALADPVGAAAEDDHLLAVGGPGLAFDLAHHRDFVGRVHVGRLGLEFGGTGVDPLEHRGHAEVEPCAAHVGLVAAGELAEPGVGEAELLERAQALGRHRQPVAADLRLGVDDLADAGEEPGVELGDGEDLGVGQPLAHRLGDHPDAVGRLHRQRLHHRGLVRRALDIDLVETGEPGFHRGQRLLQRLVDGAADRHDLAHRFHRRGELGLGAGEFLEGETRDLGDDVIDGRLEARGRHLGDVVVEFVERVADGELGRDLGDREAGGLGRQRRRARDPRVHLDHHHAAVLGVDRPLDVGAAGLDPDLAQHVDRVRAHELVFLVGQRQRRGDGDRIAGVHAHRVDVFDRADDDRVVRGVADHFHLVFLPAEQAFVDQDLADRARVHAGVAELLVIVAVVGDAATGAAEGEGGADDRRQADLVERPERELHALPQVALAVVHLGRGDDGGARVLDAEPVHRLAEQLAVLGHLDGFALGADQLDAVFVEHAHVGKRQRGVEPGLAAHGGQERIGFFLGDDLGDHLGRDRLDIGGVGHFRVGHDRRRVGVDQDDAVALFAQRLAGLGAGIVELAGLADDDGPRADDHDRLDIGSLRHGIPRGSKRRRQQLSRAEPRPAQIVVGYRDGAVGCKA